MWSMGNEEGTANTEQRRADSHGDESSRHEARWLAPCFYRAYWRHRHRRPRGLRRHRLQLHGSGRRGISQGASRPARHRHGNRERRVHARHLRDGLRQGLRRLLRSLHHHRPRLGRRLVELLQRASVARRRLCVDGLRLSRRALAQRLAQYQLAIRHHRHLRFPQRHFLLLPSRGGPRSRCCISSRTGTGRAWKAS